MLTTLPPYRMLCVIPRHPEARLPSKRCVPRLAPGDETTCAK
jgi:hypothetical protein